VKKRGGFRAPSGAVAVLAAFSSAVPVRGAEVRVAAAADLKFALDAAVTEFQASHPGVQVLATYGSTGSLFAQISNGAPFDLFLSADAETPVKLREEGRVSEDPEFVYGEGRLVLWVRNDSPLDPETLGIRALLDPSIRHVAIANPRHAPYGRAAEEALKALGVFVAVQEKLVPAENVAQAAQFVESGAADAGLVALSLALAPPMRGAGRYAELPAGSYPPIRQAGVILKPARDPAGARAFRDFLTGAGGRAVLERFGFTPRER
jgi:molybdate transport system substrate-binding protein